MENISNKNIVFLSGDENETSSKIIKKISNSIKSSSYNSVLIKPLNRLPSKVYFYQNIWLGESVAWYFNIADNYYNENAGSYLSFNNNIFSYNFPNYESVFYNESIPHGMYNTNTFFNCFIDQNVIIYNYNYKITSPTKLHFSVERYYKPNNVLNIRNDSLQSPYLLAKYDDGSWELSSEKLINDNGNGICEAYLYPTIGKTLISLSLVPAFNKNDLSPVWTKFPPPDNYGYNGICHSNNPTTIFFKNIFLRSYTTFDNIYFNDMRNLILLINNDSMFTKTDGFSAGLFQNKGASMTNAFQSNQYYMIPYIGELVTAVDRAFNGAHNAFGDPVMKSLSASTMQETYRDCWNLRGNPQCGPNVKTMCLSYYNSINLTGDVPNGDLVNNLDRTYWNCYSLNGECGYYPNALYMYQTYNNCTNIAGPPHVGDLCTNMRQCFYNCVNMKGSAEAGEKVIDMFEAYKECHSLDGYPACGEATTNMNNAYYNCYSIIGDGVCGLNVTDLFQTYANCYNLNGNASIGNKVVNAYRAYYNCVNLEGAAEDNIAVTNLVEGYYNCHSLRGTPLMPNNKTVGCNYYATFWNCTNMKGTVYIGTGSTYVNNMCYNCCNLGGIYMATTSDIALASLVNAFNRVDNHTRLNIVFCSVGAFNNSRNNTVTNADMTNVEIDNVNKFSVNLPYAYENGLIYGNFVVNCNRRSYNEEKNIYLYCTV